MFYTTLVSTFLLILPHLLRTEGRRALWLERKTTYNCAPWREIRQDAPNYEQLPVTGLQGTYLEMGWRPVHLEFTAALVRINDTFGPLFPDCIISTTDWVYTEIHTAKYKFPAKRAWSPGERPQYGVVNVSAVHWLVNEEGQHATFFETNITVTKNATFPHTMATLTTATPGPGTICKVFHAPFFDLFYPLDLGELDAGRGKLRDTRQGRGAHNFTEGPPHFCAELVTLDRISPQSVFDKAPRSHVCEMYHPPVEIEWGAELDGHPSTQWPVLCEVLGNAVDPPEEGSVGVEYALAGNIKFRKMIGNKAFVVVEHFSPRGLRVKKTIGMKG
ncbi:uncharacterized protein LOC118439454 isoform X2 [Folsomia candida]|uniref:Uncharacterized protein n=1 Tax=Folsomia candida TaxID=158441 RepID=A0A226D454_FOLCA|nr:uncharacterized protein LOC118439454 isoform X2 [Folsomia candida]OXA39963.1 hypothetical protein Fcan01_25387 [Folsomia candida]